MYSFRFNIFMYYIDEVVMNAMSSYATILNNNQFLGTTSQSRTANILQN